MKRAAILSLTAFYLLISTGMYVCMMHCAAADVFRVSVSSSKSVADKPAMDDMPCCHKKVVKLPAKEQSKDCDKHGSYSVKENIKPSADNNLKEIELVALASNFSFANANQLSTNIISLAPRGPAPPLISGRAYLIQIRSLLI